MPEETYEKTGFHHAEDVTIEQIVPTAAKMKETGYFLETISPVEHPDHFQISYIFNRYDKAHRHIYRLHLAPGSLNAPSLSAQIGAANWQEREAFEMFGLQFEGHPNLKHLLLPEGTEFFP